MTFHGIRTLRHAVAPHIVLLRRGFFSPHRARICRVFTSGFSLDDGDEHTPPSLGNSSRLRLEGNSYL